MNIEGTWALKMSTPMGEQKATLVLGANQGTITDPAGAPQPLQDLAVSGSSATWKLDIKVPMPMTIAFDVKADGDQLTGSANTPMGAMPITGARA